MSHRPVRLLLADSLEAIEKMERYVSGCDHDTFVHDEKTADAVVRNLEIIGEAARRIRAPVKASTQRGGSPRQADRSPAWNRRRLRRGHTGWEVAGGERPVRNHVPCLTGHTVNPIRPRRPASLPVLCPRASMQIVFCMGTQARAMTHVGSCPSACGQGSLACGPLQRKA